MGNLSVFSYICRMSWAVCGVVYCRHTKGVSHCGIPAETFTLVVWKYGCSIWAFCIPFFLTSRQDLCDRSRHHLSHRLLMQWSCGLYGVTKPTGYHLANGSDLHVREPGVREHKAATLSTRLRGLVRNIRAAEYGISSLMDKVAALCSRTPGSRAFRSLIFARWQPVGLATPYMPQDHCIKSLWLK